MASPGDDRLNAIESTIMLLQRDFEGLSESLIEQAKEIRRLQKKLEQVSEGVESIEAVIEDARSTDEKPPHY